MQRRTSMSSRPEAEHSVDVDPDAETQYGLGLGAPLPDLVAAGHADLGVHDAPQAEHDMKVAPDAETQAELGLGVQDMQVCMHALSRDHGDV